MMDCNSKVCQQEIDKWKYQLAAMTERLEGMDRATRKVHHDDKAAVLAMTERAEKVEARNADLKVRLEYADGQIATYRRREQTSVNRIAELEVALKPFAEIATKGKLLDNNPDSHLLWAADKVLDCHHYNRAAEVLAKEKR